MVAARNSRSGAPSNLEPMSSTSLLMLAERERHRLRRRAEPRRRPRRGRGRGSRASRPRRLRPRPAVAKAAVDHQRGRLAGTLLRADRVRPVGHRIADGAVDRAGRDRAEDVALGDDPYQALAVRARRRRRPALVHPPGRIDEARRGLEPEHVRGHDLADGGHEPIVDLGRLEGKERYRRPFARDASRWKRDRARQRLRSSACARLSSRRSRCASSASSFR